MNRRKLLGLIATVGVLLSGGAWAEDEIYTSLFSNKAVSGYDVVAYFTEGKPVKGSSEYTTEYMGAEWLFSSEENLNLFIGDPEAYAPQYGGYCAWAVAQGDTASAKPEYWKIVDGKLYLNFSRKIQDRWEKDIPGFIESANGNWPKVIE